MERRIGIVGLGIMGSAIARNLLERGWSVVGFDTQEATRATLAKDGVEVLGSAADVARAAPIVLTSLPSPAAARAVATEIAGSGAPSRIVIEASTLALDDKEAFAETLRGAGHRPLDCPISGTGAQAVMRDLVIFASGDSAAVAEAMPVFADFAKQAADVGAYGNGTRMKFVANLLVAIHNVAAAEAMMLAERAGLDLDQVVELVGAGAGGSRMFQMRAPMMIADEYEPATMRISTWQKDMDIIGKFAAGLGVPTPLFTATAPIYDEGMRRGFGPFDTAAVFKILNEPAKADAHQET
jgi:3-hydroxyisobutyrate dehydrogenase-like beta-hydroxyacid dehydrogenase